LVHDWAELAAPLQDRHCDCGATCDKKGGPTMRTVRLPLSAPVELAGAMALAVAGVTVLFPAAGCGVAAVGLPEGLGCDSALAF
jgi:hypothetical protein